MPVAPARYTEILLLHPSARTGAPRANLAARMIHRLKCATPRSAKWGYSANSPDAEAFGNTDCYYFGGAYSCLCFVDVVSSVELKDTSRRLGPRFCTAGALFRGRAAPLGAFGVPDSEFEYRRPVCQIRPVKGSPD